MTKCENLIKNGCGHPHPGRCKAELQHQPNLAEKREEQHCNWWGSADRVWTSQFLFCLAAMNGNEQEECDQFELVDLKNIERGIQDLREADKEHLARKLGENPTFFFENNKLFVDLHDLLVRNKEATKNHDWSSPFWTKEKAILAFEIKPKFQEWNEVWSKFAKLGWK